MTRWHCSLSMQCLRESCRACFVKICHLIFWRWDIVGLFNLFEWRAKTCLIRVCLLLKKKSELPWTVPPSGVYVAYGGGHICQLGSVVLAKKICIYRDCLVSSAPQNIFSMLLKPFQITILVLVVIYQAGCDEHDHTVSNANRLPVIYVCVICGILCRIASFRWVQQMFYYSICSANKDLVWLWSSSKLTND